MTYDPFFAEREAPPAAHRRSDGTWACVRRDYLAGDSAPQLAERHGVSVSAIRTRAREEGWRRADLPDAAPLADETGERDAEASPAELRRLAWARAAAAMRRGRLAEAQGWTRLVRQLDLLAEKEAAAPALQARADESLARAADTLAATRRALSALAPAAPPAAPTAPDARATASPPVLPREPGRWRVPQVRDGTGDAEVDGRGIPSTASGGPPPPRAGEDGAPGLHELHDLHGDSALPPPSSRPERCGGPGPGTVGAGVAPGPRTGSAGREDRAGESACGPSASAPPPRPVGPAAPPIPPAWVRHALGAR